MKIFAGLIKFFTGAVLTVALVGSAAGAELAGVTLPDKENVIGARLVLNGMGLRTYSFLHIHIYVAGLYLTHASNDGDAVLNSNEPKLIRFVFLHDVKAEDARKSWQEGLERNCPAPCALPPTSVDQFLASVPSVHAGDASSVLFANGKADFMLNGKPLGRVNDPKFAHVILATFVGPRATSPGLRRGLLGLPE